MEIELPHEERLYEIKQEKAVEVNQTMNYMANLFWFYVDKNWTLDSFNATVLLQGIFRVDNIPVFFVFRVATFSVMGFCLYIFFLEMPLQGVS